MCPFREDSVLVQAVYLVFTSGLVLVESITSVQVGIAVPTLCDAIHVLELQS